MSKEQKHSCPFVHSPSTDFVLFSMFSMCSPSVVHDILFWLQTVTAGNLTWNIYNISKNIHCKILLLPKIFVVFKSRKELALKLLTVFSKLIETVVVVGYCKKSSKTWYTEFKVIAPNIKNEAIHNVLRKGECLACAALLIPEIAVSCQNLSNWSRILRFILDMLS